MRAVRAGRRARRRRLRRLHGHVRAVPGLRDGVPVGRAVRPPDGGHTRHAGRRATASAPRWRAARATAALGHHRLLLAGSTRARRRAARPPRASRGSACPAAAAARGAAAAPPGDDVWLFTGCVMDAWLRRARRAQRSSRRPVPASRCPGRGGGCCGALHEHAGLADRRRTAGRADACRPCPGDAPILVDSAGCGAMLKDYGHLLGTAGGACASRPGCSTSTSGWPRGSIACPPAVAAGRRAGGRPGPVPPAPRPAGPPRRAHRAGAATSRPASSSTTRACAAAPAAPTPRCTRQTATAIRDRKLAPIARSGAERGRQRQPGLRACTSPPAGSTCATRSSWSPSDRPARARLSAWRGSSTTSAAGWRGSPRSWPTWPSCGSGSPSTPAATSCPIDEKRLTRARRAVEKAVNLLAEPDDTDFSHRRVTPTKPDSA